MRVRFAPSPTGPLHIGGVRTALYNHLLAKKNEGVMILRIEDTDQNRYVEGAETYIKEALTWTGIQIDEGPDQGGEYGPYRQSERGEIYNKYLHTLIENGWAYKAYDSPSELDLKRQQSAEQGNHNWQYDITTRGEMKNSLTLTQSEMDALEDNGIPFVVRFKIPEGETVTFHDEIRGEVNYDTNQLDDKVLFKADGFPTYHMANVIDDHLMQITHVIRGEEWLPSTPLHVLLYRAFGWEDEMPSFAHLPLILKPEGQGKLSKRDGAKLGFPVFPLTWVDEEKKETWTGYRETGFLPNAFQNLLAFLGWNPGNEQEIFSPKQLIESFSLDRVSKSGARFDYEKAKWFNQQHLKLKPNRELAELVKPYFEEHKFEVTTDEVEEIVRLFKERIEFLSELPETSYYLFEPIREFDEKMVQKKYKAAHFDQFIILAQELMFINNWDATSIEETVKGFMKKEELGFGQVLPILRLSICGTMQGPSIFDVMAFLEQKVVVQRLKTGVERFHKMINKD